VQKRVEVVLQVKDLQVEMLPLEVVQWEQEAEGRVKRVQTNQAAMAETVATDLLTYYAQAQTKLVQAVGAAVANLQAKPQALAERAAEETEVGQTQQILVKTQPQTQALAGAEADKTSLLTLIMVSVATEQMVLSSFATKSHRVYRRL
jgi:hypothetical protein